ncbi:uncharacterized protein LOC112091219 [Morus notabilis]|uniref:uncharacterized protein LOC112091219 n=1 Tax=Morus notabilis TaxID=981085 RepID=UPI000CECE77D|nr:uncharacterized protein LOC112091219 [Morus notabilis]XP_024020036.1 uncharacterized protein LOC112091219 [Morus notabilis]
MEHGAGTGFGLSSRLRDTRSPRSTSRAPASIRPISMPSLLSKSIMSLLSLSCRPCLQMKRLYSWDTVWGGLNITDVLYKFPEKVRVAVYIAANMMKNGYGFTKTTAKNFKSLHLADFLKSLIGTIGDILKWEIVIGSDLLPGIIVKPESQRLTYYHMSPVEVILVGNI